MNAVTEQMPEPLVFTDSAANKVKQLIEEEGNADLKLRVFVTGGGCSGFQYGFTFDETTNDDDTTMHKAGVTENELNAMIAAWVTWKLSSGRCKEDARLLDR